MHFAQVIAATVLLLAEADIISATAIAHRSNVVRRRNHHHHLEGAASDLGKLLRREPQSLPVVRPTNTMNETIATACIDDLGKLTSVDNPAGLAACYNIIQYDSKKATFEADLRLYQMFPPTGSFKDIPVTDIMLSLQYPPSTMFQSLTKKMKRENVERQADSMAEIQQYTLVGSFEQNLNLEMLNDTQVMSLMLPDIKLNSADSSQKPISANISSADGAWFVVGEFKDEFKAALVTPVVATAAIAAAAPFVLPGTTLGIFPTGLIITCTWTILFFLAYGLGTLGRIKYRDVYRKRKAAQAGRTGKRI